MCPHASILMLALLAGAPRGMARVGPGEVEPLYVAGAQVHHVPAFWLDREPVTNAEFLAFVKAHPEWRRDRVPALFADSRYLARWAGPLLLSPQSPPRAPAVQVSWFAARAYCAAHGARLPTEDEWELAAAADETRADAHRDPEFVERELAWYGRPTPEVLAPVGEGKPNVWGVRDLHGLVWEWVLDFGSTPAAQDAGKSCGAAAASQGDKRDYAAYMRSAFRASLDARFAVDSLGFRCARDLEER